LAVGEKSLLVYASKPSLEIAPTTLSQRTRQKQKLPAAVTAAVTYLQFKIQVWFLADQAFVSS